MEDKTRIFLLLLSGHAHADVVCARLRGAVTNMAGTACANGKPILLIV